MEWLIYLMTLCFVFIALMIVISGPNLYKKNKHEHWQLLIICADGLPESQGYDSYEEAKQAGEKQVHDDPFVVDYKIYDLSW